jgi:hypothetical protein
MKSARGGRLATMAASKSMGKRMFAHALAEGAEGLISSVPAAITGNVLNDENWEQGNPFSNILLGTAIETGIGTVMGAGRGSLGGIKAPDLPSSLAPDVDIPSSARPDTELPPSGRDVELPPSPRTETGVPTTGKPEAEIPPSAVTDAGSQLQAALPDDLQRRVPIQVDPDLPGNTVRVHYDVDANGLVRNIHMRVGAGAAPVDIQLHVQTVRLMRRYSGFSGQIHNLLRRIQSWIGRYGEPPVGSRAWEAKLEIEKLPRIIQNRVDRLKSIDLDPQTHANILDDIDNLVDQLVRHQRTLDELDLDPGRGFVAAEGKTKIIEEFLARTGKKIEDIRVSPDPKLKSSARTREFMEELEEFGLKNRDPVLQELLRIQGTYRDTFFKDFIVPNLKRNMPEDSIFTVRDSERLRQVLGLQDLPWKGGNGPDLILVDKNMKRVAVLDLTRIPSARHLKNKQRDARNLDSILPQDWKVTHVKDFYHKGGITTKSVVEQLGEILDKFGYYQRKKGTGEKDISGSYIKSLEELVGIQVPQSAIRHIDPDDLLRLLKTTMKIKLDPTEALRVPRTKSLGRFQGTRGRSHHSDARPLLQLALHTRVKLAGMRIKDLSDFNVLTARVRIGDRVEFLAFRSTAKKSTNAAEGVSDHTEVLLLTHIERIKQDNPGKTVILEQVFSERIPCGKGQANCSKNLKDFEEAQRQKFGDEGNIDVWYGVAQETTNRAKDVRPLYIGKVIDK